jgi:hypothetical protein
MMKHCGGGGALLFKVYLSLAIGYLLCVTAKKQEGILKTVGYTIGIAILVLTLVGGLLKSQAKLIKACMGMPKSACVFMR